MPKCQEEAVTDASLGSGTDESVMEEPRPLLMPTAALKSSAFLYRFLSTRVGSAVISSEIRGAAGEVSTAVTFHLQHQVLDAPLGKSTLVHISWFSWFSTLNVFYPWTTKV